VLELKGKVELYQHQRDGIEFLKRGSGALWHEQGLGKTRSALLALGGRPAVIVCPKIAKGVWVHEAGLLGIPAPLVLNGTDILKWQEPDVLSQLIILNYDIARAWAPLLLPLMSSRVLILDEAHRVRNHGTQRVRAIMPLAIAAQQVWELTGTPLVNGGLDLYYELGLLAFDNPFKGMSERAFGEQYCETRFNAFKGRYGTIEYAGLKDEDLLMSMLAGIAQRRRKAECLDLPSTLRLPLFLSRLDHSGIKSGMPSNPGAVLAQLRHELSTLKAKLTIEYIEEMVDRPVVVFGYHRNFLARVANHFKAPVIDGSTTAIRRELIVSEYQLGKHPVLVGQIEAMGTAVTLVEGHHAVFGELSFSAVDLAQAEARLHRIGQTREVTYHYLLVENSVDDLVWRIVLRKGDAIQRLDAAAVNYRQAMTEFQDQEVQRAVLTA
jgi:SWI/SNF-related matrix-associated actin-dependent regulator 1 of chromatin subfamily A